ncbi:hypothetical protein [Microvirgula sp. AG722]|uniref:hypothetical protein n=1 Tax=Microvirgula sp. AG722 TaxID=2183901 RepID=UPI00131422B7|nr:hypothetical protein [Microvirgula sp. AG722]
MPELRHYIRFAENNGSNHRKNCSEQFGTTCRLAQREGNLLFRELRFFHDKSPAWMGSNLPEISTSLRYGFSGGGQAELHLAARSDKKKPQPRVAGVSELVGRRQSQNASKVPPMLGFNDAYFAKYQQKYQHIHFLAQP